MFKPDACPWSIFLSYSCTGVFIFPFLKGRSHFGLALFPVRSTCKVCPAGAALEGYWPKWGSLVGVVPKENAGTGNLVLAR